MKTEFGPNCWPIPLTAGFMEYRGPGLGDLAKSLDQELAQVGTVWLSSASKQPECFLRLSRQTGIHRGLHLSSEPFGEIPLDLCWVYVCTRFHVCLIKRRVLGFLCSFFSFYPALCPSCMKPDLLSSFYPVSRPLVSLLKAPALVPQSPGGVDGPHSQPPECLGADFKN